MRARILLAIGLLAVLGGFARADEDAKAVFERGTALFALHRFSDAAAAYEKSFEMRPDPAILYNAAQAHRLAGNKTRALELYESLLKLYKDKVPNRAEVIGHIDQLRRAIDADHHVATAPSLSPLPSGSAPMPEPRTNIPVAPAKPSPPAESSGPRAALPKAVASTPSAAPPKAVSSATKDGADTPVHALVATSPAPEHREPITKRRWFWGVVGGAAALVIAGVVVGIVVGTSKTVAPTPSLGMVQGN